MSGTIKGLVESSSNIGILRLDEDELFASSSVRSSVDAACSAISDKIEYLTEFLGGDYEVQGAYPAWEYRKDSPLRDKMVEIFEEMYGHKPEVVAIHAGLECGLFYKKMEGLDCVSLGPDMKDIHTSVSYTHLYLYNRCHLIGYQLTGENANEKNLITGTRYLNVTGMLPFENEVADYVHSTGNPCMYRVTPIFAGKELVARGVEMEAESVKDQNVAFHVFVSVSYTHLLTDITEKK